MRASHDLSSLTTTFDETNLVPNAGLLPAAVLAQRIDLPGLIDERLKLAVHGASSGPKALTVIGSMLAGGDSIDDVAVLRAGAASPPSGPTSASSWPAMGRRRWPIRPRSATDDRRRLHHRRGPGPKKQGAAFGYTKVRDYRPQLATCASTTVALTLILSACLRW